MSEKEMVKSMITAQEIKELVRSNFYELAKAGKDLDGIASASSAPYYDIENNYEDMLCLAVFYLLEWEDYEMVKRA